MYELASSWGGDLKFVDTPYVHSCSSFPFPFFLGPSFVLVGKQAFFVCVCLFSVVKRLVGHYGCFGGNKSDVSSLI